MKKGLTFFCILTFAGLFFALRPIYQLFESRDWKEISCTIISSKLARVSSKNSASFRVAANYSYRFNDTDYTGDDFDFSGFDYDSEYEMKKVIARYAPGQTVECFVNPDNPYEAVLSRSFRQISPFAILIAGGLFLIGLASLVYEFIKKKEKNEIA